jgi:hypothetical protein
MIEFLDGDFLLRPAISTLRPDIAGDLLFGAGRQAGLDQPRVALNQRITEEKEARPAVVGDAQALCVRGSVPSAFTMGGEYRHATLGG